MELWSCGSSESRVSGPPTIITKVRSLIGSKARTEKRSQRNRMKEMLGMYKSIHALTSPSLAGQTLMRGTVLPARLH